MHNELPIPEAHGKSLPNQTFWGWLKTETALFISQIATILAIILYLSTFSYYVFGHDTHSHKRSLEEYLRTTDTIIFYSNILVCILFVLVLIFILNENKEGEYHVKKTYKRLFGEDISKDVIEKSKESLKKFKLTLISYWTYAIILYLFMVSFGEKMEGLTKDCVDIGLSVTPAFILFFCFRIIKLSNKTVGQKDLSWVYKPRNIFVSWLITVCFFVAILYRTHSLELIIYKEAHASVLALAGILFMISIALLISRLDSKLIGIPSLLITLIFGYAIIQPLQIFQDDHTIIQSVCYFLAFIFKIYFTIVIIYIMQTGRLLNYLSCNSELSKRLKDSRTHLFHSLKKND
jgi:hypothetical protein